MTNSITIIGNLTRPPELAYTNNGIARCTFSVAVNKKVGDREETSYFDCIAWRDLGENLAESLGKGARVIASGELRQHSWKTEDGQNRSRIEIVVDAAGPDLRWATATVARTAPSGNQGGQGGQGGSYGGGQNDRPAATSNEPVAANAGDASYDPFNDESPF